MARTARSGSRRVAFAALGAALLVGGCAYVARQASTASLELNRLTGPKSIAIELDRSFIERYRDRVTIDAPFLVDKAVAEPNGAEFDGDMHVAGRSPLIGLPIVLELANAKSAPQAMDLIHRVAGNGRPIPVTGVWRIWPEHAGDSAVQRDSVPPLDKTYPAHVFEIHPVISIADLDLRSTFRPVRGYRPGSAEGTLENWERATATISPGPTTIRVVTEPNLFNDVHFVMEITSDRQVVVSDGRFVWAAALTLKGDRVVENLRMVFARGTPPEIAIRSRRRGDRLHVWGLPRINYAEIARRAATARPAPSEVTGPLPYEIIVIGIY
jgi:hypothetical protein